jgi:hypothetical protein
VETKESEIDKLLSKIPRVTPVDDSGLVDIAEKRKQEIEKKKRHFYRAFRLFMTILACIIAIILALFAYKYSRKFMPAGFETEPKTQQTTQTPDDPANQTPAEQTLYRNDDYKFFLRYPLDAVLVESQTPTQRVSIVYDADDPGNKEKAVSMDETTLKQGYIFRVVVYNPGLRTLAETAKVKHDSLLEKCPTSAGVYDIVDETISDALGRRFEVENCDGNLVIHFTQRFGKYYEISQIYKGDYGYKQRYRLITDEIFKSLKFFPEATVTPTEPFKTFIDEFYGFQFTHPNLSETCCTTPDPPLQQSAKLIMLGDAATFVDKTHFDGFGVYVESQEDSKMAFGDFIARQKQILTDDYRVVTGENPKTSETAIKLGDFDALRLSGYSWQGNDLVYSKVTVQRGDFIIVFSIRNISGDSFEKILQEIFASFKVLPAK